MAETREELEDYLETVAQQLQRRLEVVKRIQEEIYLLEKKIEDLDRGWKFEVRAMQMQQGFKDSLMKQIVGKRAELIVAREDMERAQEREASVRQELEELEG